MQQKEREIGKDGEKIHVLEVVDNYFPIVDGVVRVVDNYAVCLNEKEKCTVLAPEYPNAPIADKYELIFSKSVSGGKFGVRLPTPYKDRALKKRMEKEFKAGKYDLIHCHSPVTLAIFIAKFAKKYDVPILFTMHTKYDEEINAHVKSESIRRFAKWFIKIPMKKMDYFWAVSDGAKDTLIKDYGFNVDCLVMPNGAELSPEIADENVVKRIKQENGDALSLLSVGRLTTVKEYHKMVQTVKILKERGIKAKLTFIGDGDQKENLEKLALDLGVADEVKFTGEIIDRTLLASYYLASDLYVMPSTFDTSSLAVKDAYAMSLPVLAVLGSQAAEGIIDLQNGFLAEDSPFAFADEIQHIAESDILPMVKQRCRQELFVPWEKIIDDVVVEYKKIIKKHKEKI